VLDVDHTGTSPDDPVVLLRADYDAWRAEHPCPEPGGAGGATSEGVGGSAPPPTPNDDATQDAGCTLRAGPTTSLAIVAATAALALASRRRRRHR
ncbi:MAG: hypothetical protein KC731_23680, partial [Myxococcales bacterium]|nr:hypothetical protein [Myxococcales bacterium]